MCAEPTVQKGAATAKVADKRHRLRELIRVSGDLPALHAAPEIPPPTSPQQDQDGLQAKNWKIHKSPQLILLPASPGVSSLPNQAKLLQLHLLGGVGPWCGGGNNFSCHGNSEISASCQLEATLLSYLKEERRDEHRCCQYFL
ncbi:hypothetical protein BaRGS_00039944 [Batillaria attramentaria]|uniref:Uncharacterized protein n=1 Tax=Batillaria attramentaria TaxID=370345 RepID=A0ABD0J2D2_9CAEN